MPIAQGEQSNIPQNDAELNAATAKRLAAEAREQEAHETARAQREGMVMMQRYMNIFGSIYELAANTGQMNPVVNAAGHVVAEVLASVPLEKREDELKKMFSFIRARRDEILEIRRKAALAANEPQPQQTGD